MNAARLSRERQHHASTAYDPRIEASFTQLLWKSRRALAGLRFPLGRRALRHGVAPTLSPQALLQRLRPDVVIDVGANRGQFSLDVLAVDPGTRILAFEPLHTEAAVYKRVLGGTPSVELRELALGARAAKATMHVARAADSSSLLAQSDAQRMTFPGTDEVALEDVVLTTLDDQLRNTSLGMRTLLKIDVQGYELEVLKGADEALEAVRWVYAELSFLSFYVDQPLASEVISYLYERGFHLADIGIPARSRGRSVQVDALFERVQ